MFNFFYFIFLLPAIYQLIIGSLVLKNKITISLQRVSLISMITLDVMLGVYLVKSYPGWKQTNLTEGIWMFTGLSLISILVLVAVIAIQWKALRSRK